MGSGHNFFRVNELIASRNQGACVVTLEPETLHQPRNVGIREFSNRIIALIGPAMVFSRVERNVDFIKRLRDLIGAGPETLQHRPPQIIHQAVTEGVAQLPAIIAYCDFHSGGIVKVMVVQATCPSADIIRCEAVRAYADREL